MKFFNFFVIGTCCLFTGSKVSDVDTSILKFRHSSPWPSFVVLAKSHSLISDAIIFADFPVVAILNVYAYSQVFSSIIKTIAVFVVSLFAWLTAKYHAVHAYAWSSPVAFFFGGTPYSIKTTLSTVRVPIPLRKPFKVFRIYDCVLALRQWNKSVRLVERLRNLVFLHGAFHWSTSNGLVNISRILAYTDN